MRIVAIAQTAGGRMYPRFIAEKREGRFKGQYPNETVRNIPHLRRQWDRGGLGTGGKLTEIESDSAEGLIEEIRKRGMSPVHDDFEFYMIRSPGLPRERLPPQRLFEMAQRRPQ